MKFKIGKYCKYVQHTHICVCVCCIYMTDPTGLGQAKNKVNLEHCFCDRKLENDHKMMETCKSFTDKT